MDRSNGFILAGEVEKWTKIQMVLFWQKKTDRSNGFILAGEVEKWTKDQMVLSWQEKKMDRSNGFI